LAGERFTEWNSEIVECVRSYRASGDTRHWGRIFEICKKPVFIRCLRLLRDEEEAKDLTGDTFVKTFEKIESYDADKPFLPWICRIADNLCIDHIRRKSRIRFTQTDDWENMKAEDEAHEAERKDVPEGRLQKAVDQLKKPQKICFSLFYVHEKSYDEIVRLTGFTYNEVRSHIQNGRRKFKLFMEQRT
jgi:RNA polymerase sigma factor (sigma-70 family)